MKCLHPLAVILPLALTLLLAGCAVKAPDTDSCPHNVTIASEVSVEGITELVVNARSGDLQIQGEEGLTTGRISGKACASSQDLLAQMDVTATRNGNALQVDVIYPKTLPPAANLYVDLTIAVPSTVTARVKTSSGGASISRLAALELDHGSGGVEISQINGPLQLTSGSGSLTLAEIAGDVRISDKGSGTSQISQLSQALSIGSMGSGDLRVEGVSGPVSIQDKGSGELTIRDVQASVEVEATNSGDMTLEKVGGDVRIGEKGSGSFRIRQIGKSLSLGTLDSGDLTILEVGGPVTIQSKGSGEIDVADLEGGLHLVEAGSGRMDVRNVKGDLIIEEKGSGDLTYRQVTGRVQVPHK